MPAYAVATVTIRDRDTYRRYEDAFLPTLEPFAGRVLAVEEAPRVVEGEWPATRTVILSFESMGDAQAWYDSAAYQAIVAHRHRASSADFVLLRGLPAS